MVADHTPRGVDAFTAIVDVDATGRVAMCYYDFRNDRPGDTVLSNDLGHALARRRPDVPDESRLTTASFDMRTAPDALGYFVGATGAGPRGTTFHPTWIRTNSGNLANRTDVFHRTAADADEAAASSARSRGESFAPALLVSVEQADPG